MVLGLNQDDPVLLRAMVGLLPNTLKKTVWQRKLVKTGENRRNVPWRPAL